MTSAKFIDDVSSETAGATNHRDVLRPHPVFSLRPRGTKAASGIVSSVRTGEIVAVVSLPDFDPNNPREAKDPDRINRLTTNVHEMGSTFKAFTLAILPVD